jgi:hypothetical protein
MNGNQIYDTIKNVLSVLGRFHTLEIYKYAIYHEFSDNNMILRIDHTVDMKYKNHVIGKFTFDFNFTDHDTVLQLHNIDENDEELINRNLEIFKNHVILCGIKNAFFVNIGKNRGGVLVSKIHILA